MFGPSEDPLYRSDSRTTSPGSQQADLAPVSDQPSEHWEQQAAQREADEPAAPTDPLGAQPQAEAPQPDAAPTPTSAENGSQPAAQTAPEPGPTPAPSSSPADEQTATSTRDASTDATVDHDTTVTLGGELAWSDPSGDHARSGEVSVNLSQAASVGGASSMVSQSTGDAPQTTDATAAVDAVAQGALAQAAALAGDGLAIGQSGVLGEALGQVSVLPSALDGGVLPGLDSLTESLGEATSATGALLDTGLEDVAGGLAALPALDAVPALEGLPGLDALPGLTDAAPLDAVSAPSGLLAALFAPDVGEPADLLGGGVTETALEDAAPALLTDLTSGLDDQPDLGLGLGL